MPNLPLEDLVVHREALFNAYDDCFWRHACSKTLGPIEVMPLEKEPGKFQLVDGYHRLVQYLIDRKHVSNNGEIPVKINNDPGIQGYYAVALPNERWEYDGSLKYGNLEDLAVVEILDDHVKTLRKKNKIAKSKNLFESKQTLINIGFPEVIASLFYEIFPKNAVLLAKWFREYSIYSKEHEKDWWRMRFSSLFRSRDTLDLYGLVKLYEAGKKSQKDYNEMRRELRLWVDPDEIEYPDAKVDQETLNGLRDAIKEKLLEDVFFSSTIVDDVLTGKLKDLKPYENLSFQEAKDKYDSLRIFDQRQIIKTYKNGWKWINAGAKCQLVGGLMRNCGSTGVMSTDPDKTMLTLFDPNNKPHVVVTYSPNENRISGDEGVASTPVKDAYHKYVLDLSDHLGARFDASRSKSTVLKIKAILRDKLKNIKQIGPKDALYPYYFITLQDGNSYYSNGYIMVPAQYIASKTESGKITIDSVRAVFRELNQIRSQDELPPGSFPLRETINFIEHFELIIEAILDTDRKAIENANPNTILTVYHGTPLFRLPQLINGFDSTAEFSRDYRAGKHRGLFITPDFELAKGFGGGAIIELKVPAKFIHGTDWSGFIGREQEKEKGKSTLDWVKSNFPNSFRPYMSYTMLASGEPQGLLIGVVKPSQITKIWIKDRQKGGETWIPWDRKDYLNSKQYYNTRRVLDRTEYDYFFDAEINMANPRLSLEELVKALAKFENREGFETTYIDYYKRTGKRDPERLKDQLANIEIGGSRLGKLALENVFKQIMTLVNAEENTNESKSNKGKGLIIEIMTHSKKLLEEGKIYNSNRFRKLAGILSEAVEPGEMEMALMVTKAWLQKDGKEKIANYIESRVREFYESGEHISGDRERYYSVAPEADEFANKDELLDAHINDIAEMAPEELKAKILDFDLSEDVYGAMADLIGKWAGKIFPEIVAGVASEAPRPRRPRGGWGGEER